MAAEYRTPYDSTPTTGNTGTGYGPILTQRPTYTGTEANAQIKWPKAETFKDLRAYVSANAASATATISFRINGADGSLTVPVTAGATGWFEDASNSDAVAAGDLINFCITRTDAGSITFKSIGIDAVDDVPSATVGCWAASGAGFGTASATRYFPGQGAIAVNTSETAGVTAYTARAATAKKMKVYISSNARGTTTTYKSRINGADGNQSIPVTAAATGWFEDASNSDTLVAGDYFNFSIATGTGTGSITTISASMQLEDAGTSASIISSGAGTLSTNQTRYWGIIGGAIATATEDDAEFSLRGTGTIRNFYIQVASNTSDQTSTFTARKNNADTAITFSVTATSTGNFGDAVNSFTYADGDEVCLKGVRAAGGSGTITPVRVFFEIVPDNEGTVAGKPWYYYAQM